MARETDTRDQILRTAGRLLQSRGYNGFSYAHISEALGIKPAAIHYHFRSKEDLGVALAERFRDGWAQLRERHAHDPATRRLEVLYDLYAHFAEKGRTCPIGVIHAEMDAVPEAVSRAAKEVIDELLAWLEQALEEGRSEGSLSFPGSPRELALVLVAGAQGSLQLARSQGPEAFEAARRRTIAALFPERAGA